MREGLRSDENEKKKKDDIGNKEHGQGPEKQEDSKRWRGARAQLSKILYKVKKSKNYFNK